MTWLRLVRAELRKLTTTRMPWAFLAVLVAIAATTGVAIVVGTDMDGSKDFLATAADQQSLLAFGWNAMLIAGLFGAIAAAREYGHNTVVPTFLMGPRRQLTVLAQLTAIFLAGAVLGLLGEALTLAAGAISLPFTDYAFMLSAGTVAQLLGASALAAAIGGVMGAGAGIIVRNTGGAVTAAVVLLLIAPPLVIQLATATADWVPNVLVPTISGLEGGPSLPAAVAALAAWGLLPALIGIATVQRRDIV